MTKLMCHLLGHNFGEWEYLLDDCEQIRSCRRSLDHQETRTLHEWGKWSYIEANRCDQIRICKRSEQHKEKITAHDWKVITNPNCPHCGGSGFYVTEKAGDWWEPDPGDKYPTVNDLPPEAFQEPEPITIEVTCECKHRICNRCKEKQQLGGFDNAESK